MVLIIIVGGIIVCLFILLISCFVFWYKIKSSSTAVNHDIEKVGNNGLMAEPGIEIHHIRNFSDGNSDAKSNKNI